MSKGKGKTLVGGAKSRLELNPIPTKMLRGLKQTLCTLGPRDPTETETELCLRSVRVESAVVCRRDRGSGFSRPEYGIRPLGGGCH